MSTYNKNQQQAERKGRQYFDSLFKGKMDYIFTQQEFCCYDQIANYGKDTVIIEIKTASKSSEQVFIWRHALEIKKYNDMMDFIKDRKNATRAFFFEFYEEDGILKIWDLSSIKPHEIKTGTRWWNEDQADGGKKKVLKDVIELNHIPVYNTMKFKTMPF